MYICVPRLELATGRELVYSIVLRLGEGFGFLVEHPIQLVEDLRLSLLDALVTLLLLSSLN